MPFAQIQYEWIDDPRIDAAMLAVLCVLVRHADFHTGKCYPSQTRIASLLGKSRRWVQPKLDALDSLGIIHSDTSSKTTVYTVGQPAAGIGQYTAAIGQPAATNKNHKRKPRTISIQPQDFVPRPEDISVMQKEKPHVDLDSETRKFIEWFGEQGGPISNPYIRWRNWIRRCRPANTQGGQRTQRDTGEQRRSKLAEVVASLETR